MIYGIYSNWNFYLKIMLQQLKKLKIVILLFYTMTFQIIDLMKKPNFGVYAGVSLHGKSNGHQKRTGLRLSCLDNMENGGLPHFFAILVVFWAECCGGQNTLGKILKLWIMTGNRPG